MDTLEHLQTKMGRAKIYERTVILLGVYKQIVETKRIRWYKEPNEDGGFEHRKEVIYRRNKGECRDYYERSDENKEKMVEYLHEQMIWHDRKNCAARLKEQLLKDLTD